MQRSPHGRISSQISLPMKKTEKVVISLFAILIAALFLTISQYVWIPDVLVKEEKVIGEQVFDGNRKIIAKQFWNGVDFYTTYVVYQNSHGVYTGYQISGDDKKHWSSDFKLDKEGEEIMIFLSDEFVAKLNFIEEKFYNVHGELVQGGIIK